MSRLFKSRSRAACGYSDSPLMGHTYVILGIPTMIGWSRWGIIEHDKGCVISGYTAVSNLWNYERRPLTNVLCEPVAQKNLLLCFGHSHCSLYIPVLFSWIDRTRQLKALFIYWVVPKSNIALFISYTSGIGTKHRVQGLSKATPAGTHLHIFIPNQRGHLHQTLSRNPTTLNKIHRHSYKSFIRSLSFRASGSPPRLERIWLNLHGPQNAFRYVETIDSLRSSTCQVYRVIQREDPVANSSPWDSLYCQVRSHFMSHIIYAI